MGDIEVRRVETFETRLRPLGLDDLAKLHELTIGVGWPHRAEDIRLLVACGEGLSASDPIDRAIGSAMWFPSGDDFATIGMVIITPQLQTLGAGRWLMDHVLRRCAGRDLMLVATPEAYRLYYGIGFEPVGVVAQHQGIARAGTTRAPLTRSARLRPATGADVARIAELDTAAFGVDRRAILTAVLEASHAEVLERDGRVEGFVLDRPFGRGRLIGPMVAASDEDAVALAADRIAAHIGEFVRIDVPLDAGRAIAAQTPDAFGRAFSTVGIRSALSEHVVDRGLDRQDRNTIMRMGRDRPPRDGWITYALAAQAIG